MTLRPNFGELRNGEVRVGVKVCIAASRYAWYSGRGMPISPSVMFLMYKFGRLVLLVYIRQPLRHRYGAKQRVGA